METIAVYWEAQVRIYGLTERRGLSLWTVDFPRQESGGCAEMLAELDADGSFDLVFFSMTPGLWGALRSSLGERMPQGRETPFYGSVWKRFPARW